MSEAWAQGRETQMARHGDRGLPWVQVGCPLLKIALWQACRKAPLQYPKNHQRRHDQYHGTGSPIPP